MIYMLLLFSSILLGACVRDIIDDVPVPDEDNEIDKNKGFSGKSNKSIIDLKEEADYLISKFESDKSDIEILKELELCEKELKDIYKHVLGFLLEMVREDDPYGDHSDLENMFFKELGIFQN